MVLKKILTFIIIIIIMSVTGLLFFWDIPAPTKKIDKNLEIHRLKNND